MFRLSFSPSVAVSAGTEIETIAKDTSIDVFVEAYAPWCGQCKKLAPKYEALAKSYAGDANMVIAALDATENDIEGVKITG
jgi:protein disulfide-isomerase A1